MPAAAVAAGRLVTRSKTDAAADVSWPAGAGTPEYRADLPRSDYAQERAVHAGPAPAAPDAWRIRTPVPDAARAALKTARAPNASAAVPPWAVPQPPPPLPARGGRDRPRPAAAAAMSAVSPDAPRQAHRGGRESRSAPEPAVLRCAAYAWRATASVPVAAE